MSKYVKSYNLKPTIYKSRSKFPLNHSHKTMFNEGDLVPILVQEVYPGDTFNVDTNYVIRTTAPFIRPIMDNLFIDIRYFFVPNRLVYDKWPEVMGENKTSAWAPDSYAEVPTVNGTISTGSVADYMGLKNASTETTAIRVSRLPFRAFGLIYDEWFRDENLQQPMLINKSDIDNTSLNNKSWAPNNIYGMLPKVNKLHDYFTSCLPAPQKGDPVSVSLNGVAPVITTNLSSQFSSPMGTPLYWMNSTSGDKVNTSGFIGVSNGDTQFGADPAPSTGGNLAPLNLVIKGDDLGASINDLRMAGALQRLLEKDARGGTRYTEYIQEHFGVINPDARLQRSEYLGGSRQPLALQQVQQTSQSSTESPLAQVGASSLTNGRSGFTKGFTEHGFVIGVACVRQFHTYQQGVERFWTRTSRYDFYDPVFANIGEQPVYQYEIYANATNIVGKQVFGYNEAWADLRYRPSRVSGPLTSQSGEGFDIWHLGDSYSSAPVLGSDWIKEGNNIDRCLSVPSTTAPNFIADFYFNMNAIRELPTYSIPGLFDHN